MRTTMDEARSRWVELQELSPALRAFLARRCRDENEIDDVVQETLLRAVRRVRQCPDVHSPRAWLIRIATNVLCDRARGDRRHPTLDSELEETQQPVVTSSISSSEDPLVWIGDRWVEQSTLLRHLAPALADLDETDRDVLGRYYLDGLDCRQTARRCGLTAGLVKVRLFRARRRLGRALVRRVAVP